MNFILGSGRSGTTLLVTLLNNSPETIATPEVNHFIYFYKKYRHVTEVSPQLISDYENYLQLVHDTKPLLNFIPVKESHISKLKPGTAINYAQLTKLFFLCLFQEKSDIGSIKCMVDKNPFYTFCIHEITDVFPEANILIMQRDARAFVFSNRQHHSRNYRVPPSVSYWSFVWNLYAKEAIAIKKKSGAQVLTMRYEDFVQNKDESVKRIAGFFGIHFSEEIFKLEKRIRGLYKKFDNVLKDEKVNKMIKKLLAPVNASRVNVWQEGLSLSEKKRIDFICGESAAAFGYEKVSSTNFLEGLFFRLRAIPAYIRVSAFNLFRSVSVYHYLNVNRNIKRDKKTAKRFAS